MVRPPAAAEVGNDTSQSDRCRRAAQCPGTWTLRRGGSRDPGCSGRGVARRTQGGRKTVGDRDLPGYAARLQRGLPPELPARASKGRLGAVAGLVQKSWRRLTNSNAPATKVAGKKFAMMRSLNRPMVLDLNPAV